METYRTRPLSNYQTAQDELTRIERRRDPEHGRWKDYYRLVTDCLRHFLAEHNNIQTANRSAPEMQRALRHVPISSTQLSPAEIQSLLELFVESDKVQKATYLPGLAQGRQVIGRARAMVEQMNLAA